MIPIVRGDEPAVLTGTRVERLAMLRTLGRPPNSKDVDGYRIVASQLWRVQYFKCCYCEQKVKIGFNDVEHFRPKVRADRSPGCGDTHGYWWLAFTWENLLFACPGCNRSGKNDRFPIDHGSAALVAEEVPPGDERPLLIDPAAGANPTEEIEFVFKPLLVGGPKYWCARPRKGTLRAATTIEVLKLNCQELLELRNDYVEAVVIHYAHELKEAIIAQDVAATGAAYSRALRLLGPKNQFVALASDALRTFVSDADIHSVLGVSWPPFEQVGV